MPTSHHEDLLRSALSTNDIPALDLCEEWEAVTQRLAQPQASPRGMRGRVAYFATHHQRRFLLSIASLVLSLGMVGCVIHAATSTTQNPSVESVMLYNAQGHNSTQQYIDAITQRYPLHPLSQTQQIGGVTVTTSGVYADASHTFLAMDFSAPARFGQFTITAQKGIVITAGTSFQFCTPTIPNQVQGPFHCLIVLPPFREKSTAVTSLTTTLTIHSLWLNEEYGGIGRVNNPPQEVHGIWTFHITTPYFPNQHSVISSQLQQIVNGNG